MIYKTILNTLPANMMVCYTDGKSRITAEERLLSYLSREQNKVTTVIIDPSGIASYPFKLKDFLVATSEKEITAVLVKLKKFIKQRALSNAIVQTPHKDVVLFCYDFKALTPHQKELLSDIYRSGVRQNVSVILDKDVTEDPVQASRHFLLQLDTESNKVTLSKNGEFLETMTYVVSDLAGPILSQDKKDEIYKYLH